MDDFFPGMDPIHNDRSRVTDLQVLQATYHALFVAETTKPLLKLLQLVACLDANDGKSWESKNQKVPTSE